jgi:excisionase family DNA binding protein
MAAQRRPQEDPLRTTEWLAGYVAVPVQTIYQWRLKGTGPRAIKVGKHLRFRQTDVDAWLEAHSDERTVA